MGPDCRSFASTKLYTGATIAFFQLRHKAALSRPLEKCSSKNGFYFEVERQTSKHFITILKLRARVEKDIIDIQILFSSSSGTWNFHRNCQKLPFLVRLVRWWFQRQNRLGYVYESIFPISRTVFFQGLVKHIQFQFYSIRVAD